MPEDAPAIFSCKDLTVEVVGRTLVTGLNLEVARGELIAVLGQNGSGKSLTLHTMAGLRPAHSGSIRLLDNDVANSKRQELAKHLALLPQHVDDIFPATVIDTALIGRHPHIGRMSWESPEDIDVATAALASVDLEELAARDVLTLSGGERRRLAIAQVLTQTPDHREPARRQSGRTFRRPLPAALRRRSLGPGDYCRNSRPKPFERTLFHAHGSRRMAKS